MATFNQVVQTETLIKLVQAEVNTEEHLMVIRETLVLLILAIQAEMGVLPDPIIQVIT